MMLPQNLTKKSGPPWLWFILTCLLLSVTLGGCGQSVAPPASESQPQEAAAEPTEAAVAPTEAVAEPTEAAMAATEAAAAATEEAAAEAPADVTPIKIGVVATLTGPFAVLGEDGVRGVELAVAEFGGEVAGRPIELLTESSDATPDSAVNAVRKLVEQENVDLVVGPLSGDEGLAVRDYARDQPAKTFINGTSAAQDTTLRDPAPNFYRFSTDGVQWMAGLGTYAYETKGYERVVTVAEDYSFPYSQVGGFLIEFCQAGGEVADKFWVPIGTKDFSSVVSSIPTDVDAIYVALGGADSLNFLKQYEEFGGTAPLIGASITLDQSILGSEGSIADYVVGTPAAGPIADDNPEPAWQEFVKVYQEKFPDGLPSPSLFAHGYYVNAKAALLALEQVGGDLSDGEQKFQEALSTLEFDSPTGPIKLDHNRQAITNIFVTEVDRGADGNLYNKLVKVIPEVNQTLGLPEEQFLTLGSLNRDNPSCEGVAQLAMAAGEATGAAEATEEAAAAPADTTPLKVGVVATLTGPFAVLGEDGVRGVELAVAEFGGEIAGRPIELLKESSDATPDSAVNAVRKLVEQENVDVVVGPLSGDEGLAVRDYARDQLDKTFVNGTSAAQDTTLRDPAPNFYRFSTDGVQWMAGLGTYAYETKGYERVVTVAEDYSFPYSQVGGFLIEFCRAGGVVADKFWVPIGTKDFSSVVSSIPTDVDAIYVALGGADSLNFLKQYEEFGGTAPLIGGSVTLDQSILGSEGSIADYVVGTPAAGPIADDNTEPAWQEFVKAYQEQFPDGLPSPSLFAHGYYVNAKAILLAIAEVNGDLSDGQKNLQATLSKLEFDSPTGPIKLDHNRQAITNIFLTEVDRGTDGQLYNKLIKVVPDVNQTLGIAEEEFLAIGPLDRDNPACSP